MVDRRAALGLMVTIAVLSGCTVATGQSSPEAPEATVSTEAITQAEAVVFTERLIDAAATDRSVSFCEQFAANRTMCERSLLAGGSAGVDLTAWSSAELSVRASHSGSAIVTLDGPDGTVSEIEVLRDGSDFRAVDPVFWVERTIVG